VAYTIQFKTSAARELRKLPAQVEAQIRPVIDALANDPRPSSVVKMHGYQSTYRVRSGDFRVVYEIHDEVLTVLVVRVANRRDAYRQL
jgi:mRNA interferase RelE/StbE